ncbi:MAG: cation-translocating P-type ATPase [Actinomycetia bacterium]|nr:cation-translocating P-type ATPase [Actinomycetes bacterium]
MSVDTEPPQPQPAAGHDMSPHTLDTTTVAANQAVDPGQGLTKQEAALRLGRVGPNEIPKQPPPSFWEVVLKALRDPMNMMLVAVAVASILIGQVSTGILVAVLVTLNVVMAANQELKAKATVNALEDMQVPSARVLRGGSLVEVPARDLVPGDIVNVEAGDLVPADGRIIASATLEVQEAALTGESAPVAKDVETLSADVALGDRTNMLFQNTAISRGTATIIVTGTGADTEMGHIAGMLSDVEVGLSPLQTELNNLTKWIGLVAWGAVAVIVIIGLFRGLELEDLILLAIVVAISAIPSGMPTFVQLMLSSGARRLAESKAVVKNLTDVETLGSTSAINSDKTGTLTLNQMTARRMLTDGRWYSIEGGGYEKSGAILAAAGDEAHDFENLGLGLCLCSDATVSDAGEVIGDPTEAALVVLAAKAGVDAEITRREHPRIAEVPFDSAYKFMATFHENPLEEGDSVLELVKGAPDVVLARCSEVLWRDEIVPIEQVRDELLAANQELSEKGLRVLSFAVRKFEHDPTTGDVDPMDLVADLVFVSLVGIIDPLRPSAKHAVEVAHRAGIEVRMITGDHAVTAQAIAADLGLGEGVTTGPEFQKMTDAELTAAVPHLHVFGRVAPRDKLRLVASMQESGEVVAMTGDAVNDAAALKKADIGVAMGSGSEVTKQAARMILTDDNFSTLVKAVRLGRDIYEKISTYLRYQLTGLFGVLLLMLIATAFNINSGVALTPGMLLYISLIVAVWAVLAIMTDVEDPSLMDQLPRDPTALIFNRHTGLRWFAIGLVTALACVVPLVWGPDEPKVDAPSIAMTMAFAVAALAGVPLALVQRRDPTPVWTGPFWPYVGWLGISAALTWLAVELPLLQRWLDTTTLTGMQWLAVIGLTLASSVIAEADKALRRHRS